MFKLVSDYKPTGDQPKAIEYLSNGIKEGKKFQTLLGVTGSGKTFTMANIIQQVQKPTLVLAHNKTLAGQLYSEFKEFFPRKQCGIFCKLLWLLKKVSLFSHFQPLLVLISLVKNDQISLKKLIKTKQTKKVCDRIRVKFV